MMPDLEKDGETIQGYSGKNSDDPSDHMWSLYLAKAENFDKALVESWKGDMDGILIFAGLFSASVTAFIIESYKKLSPDSGDMTVTLLTQISSQLVAISNGTNLNVSSPPAAHLLFYPTSSVIAVNILWFLSLTLALLCALSTTLVEQWARNYLQLIERLPAPNKRARIRAYMYEGVKMFRMTAVVEAIPTLLHVSLFFFIIGLVVFLFPINLRVALTLLIVLTAVVILYATVTFLPMRHKNCPYQTPLSSTCWTIMQHFKLLWYHNYDEDFPFPSGKTVIRGSMAEGRTLVAMAPSPKRSQRDEAALDWTLESATDYSELEQFLVAVPAFYRPSQVNEDGLLVALGSSVFHRSVPMLQECILQADVQSPTWRRHAMACMTALHAVVPKLPTIHRNRLSVSFASALEDLRNDSDITIASQAICTKATLASNILFRIAESIPSESKVFDNDAADEQLLLKISEQLPVDELATSLTVRPHKPIEISKPPADVTSNALRILKSDDVIEAADRYLKCCKAYNCPEIGKFFPMNPQFCDIDYYWFFIPERVVRSLDWINRRVICEAEFSVQYLRNPNQDPDGRSTDRAVWGMSWMLRGLRMKRMRKEFFNCGRFMVINTLLTELMQCQHDTRGHSAFILETLHQLIDPSPPDIPRWSPAVSSHRSKLSVNDADQDTQANFIRLIKAAVSPVHGIRPFTVPVVELLIRILSEVEHPTSIASAIDAIDGKQWLLDSKFPLEETVERLRAKLTPQSFGPSM